MNFSLDFPYAYEEPQCEALFRSKNEDFIVDEILNTEFTNEGEHLYLHVKKEGENTHWVAEKIAEFFKVKANDVGYAGKKDRNAITTQWFSVYLPGIKEVPDIKILAESIDANIEILRAAIHRQKLRLGTHQSNQFKITLRELSSVEGIADKLGNIKEGGVPNYFGEQRFGWGGNNLQLADEWFRGETQIKNRNKKGLVLSASRSYLFNIVLAKRLDDGNWNVPVEGEVLVDDVPSAPMWGRGRSSAQSVALEIEQEVLKDYAAWCDALEHKGLSQERRVIVTKPQNIQWNIEGNTLELVFGLPPGQFATSVLREITKLRQPEQDKNQA